MAVETELKLRIAPSQLDRLKRHALLKRLSVSKPVTSRLFNIYFDTPGLDLHGAGMALRLRESGRQWLQTLKGGGSVHAGLHQRNEWEVEVAGPRLDFSKNKAVNWDEHLRPALRRKLRQVFITDFFRTTLILDFKGSTIELCVDHGMISIEDHSLPICELELELKSGESGRLIELAQEILEVVPVELESFSKAEKGYRLLSNLELHPSNGVMPQYSKKDSLSVVLRQLAWSCLQQFQDNLPGVMGYGNLAKEGTEYLHQMRVALRRLRVVMRMMEKISEDENLAGMYKDVTIMGANLGRVREWDVFIKKILEPLCRSLPKHDSLAEFLERCNRKREAYYDALREGDQVRERQRLLLRFSSWMNSDYWEREVWQPDESMNTREFAIHRLSKLSKRFLSMSHRLDKKHPEQLHALRILAKKLKYSSEFLAPSFDKRRSKPYLAALGRVQEVLGKINDIEVADRLLEGLKKASARSDNRDVFSYAKEWIDKSARGLHGDLRKSLKKVAEQPDFWNK